MSSLFKRVFVGVRTFASAMDTANAVRHGAPVSAHARQYSARDKSGAAHS